MLPVLLVLICLSSFFSAAETALTSINKMQLRNMMDENVKNAELVNNLIQDPNKLLSAILIGNNLVNIAASAIATSLAMAINPEYGVAVSTVIMTIIVLIFGEITPKTLATIHAEKLSLAVSKIIAFLVKLFAPLIFLLNKVTGVLIRMLGGNSGKVPVITEAQLKTMVNVSHEVGVLEVDERRMIHNVFDFGDSKAKDVMTPRTDVIAVSVDSTVDEIIALFQEEHLSKIPVYKESIDNIIGILIVKDFAFIDKNDFDIEKFMREPFYTYESKGTSELFSQMRNKRLQLAVVLDEYGGTAGIVSTHDLVEEIVGDISDEYDELNQEIERISDDEYIIDGAMKLDDLNEVLKTNFVSENFDSIGGYILGIIGRFPEADEKIDVEHLKFVVEEIDKNRIVKLRMFKNK